MTTGNAKPLTFPPLTTRCAGDWDLENIPEVDFVIRPFVPRRMLTGIVGEGGVGKSQVLQTMLTCAATVNPFHDLDTAPGKTIGLFFEDDLIVLQRRQAALCRALNVGSDALKGNLFLIGADDVQPLWSNGKPTSAMENLIGQIRAMRDVALLTIDPAALAYTDDENARTEVSRFGKYLNDTARDLNIAIVLALHKSKSTDGSTLRVASGSTAWVNTARSILLMTAQHNGTTAASLELVKANHARPGTKIDLVWDQGALIAERKPDDIEVRARNRQLDRLIITTVKERWERDDPVSATPQTGSRYLPRVINRTDSGFKVGEVELAMEALINGGTLASEKRNAKLPRGLRVLREPPELAQEWVDVDLASH